MYENNPECSKKREGNCSKTKSGHNEVWLSIVLNKENVIIDTFSKEAHLYDKLTNHWYIFFSGHILHTYFFVKNAKSGMLNRDEQNGYLIVLY